MAALALKIGKIILFLLIMVAIGRCLGDPYGWINHDFGYWVVRKLYGNEDAGVENIENVFFLISFICLLVMTSISYAVIITLIKRFR